MSSFVVLELSIATGGIFASVMVTVAVCVPNSVAPFPPATPVMFAITVSDPSKVASLVGSIVTVPVVEPAGITIVTLDAT
jgi:hypothetical protein